MATRCRTTRSFVWPVIGSARLRRGPSCRAICLSLAGFLVVSAMAGCGGGATSPTVPPNANGQPPVPTAATQSAAPAAATQPGRTAAAPTATLAHGPTGFSATGSMTDARFGHTATLLADGRVLVVGGEGNGSGPLASAELYDPASGKFSATGSMTEPRAYHTATLLSDGRVLIAGGLDGKGDGLASAELYDPATGTFNSTGSMTAARSWDTATLLPDGRVLIAGGQVNSDTDVVLASAELYDPATGKFNPTGSMTAALSSHTATLLSDGHVLIAGGVSTDLEALASAELYDPASGKFSPAGSMTAARSSHTATLLSDGRVLIAGGIGTDLDAHLSAELYDPKTGKFSATGWMAVGRDDSTATLLSNGRVLIAGGEDAGITTNLLASAELYDPATGTFKPTGTMRTARELHTATLLADGRVLIAGGGNQASAAFASAELYQP